MTDPHSEVARTLIASADQRLDDLRAVAYVAGETLAKLLRRRERSQAWTVAEAELNRLCGQLTEWQIRPAELTVDAWTKVEQDFARGIASLNGAELAAVRAVGRVVRREV